MRISDWSSDVCSSDLHELPVWAERLEADVAELADHLGGGQLPGGDLRARAPAGGLGRLHPQAREPGDLHQRVAAHHLVAQDLGVGPPDSTEERRCGKRCGSQFCFLWVADHLIKKNLI